MNRYTLGDLTLPFVAVDLGLPAGNLEGFSANWGTSGAPVAGVVLGSGFFLSLPAFPLSAFFAVMPSAIVSGGEAAELRGTSKLR